MNVEILNAYDRQAAQDMGSWRKRSGVKSAPKPYGKRPKSVSSRRRVLEAALSGPQVMGQFAIAAGYTSTAAAFQMVASLEDEHFLSIKRTRVPGKTQVHVVVSITTAGREWLAQNGGGELAAQEARA